MRAAGRAGIAVVLATLACGGGGRAPKRGAPAERVHGVGEVAALGDFQVQVHGASRARSVGGKFVNHAAPSGATLRIVDLSVENGGDQPVAMVGRFLLVEGERTFVPTAECQIALKDGWRLLDPINPGIRHRGRVCFEIPEGADPDFGFKEGLLKRPAVFDLD